MKKEDKIRKLEDIAKYHISSQKGGFTHGWEDLYDKYKKYRFLSLKPYFKGDSVLEIGPAEGEMTTELFKCFKEVSVLEGSESFIENLRRTFKKDKLNIYTGLVEEVKINKKFDTIILSHVLEHFDCPKTALKKISTFLNDKGVLLIIVPNANSLHRHLGVILGMIKDIHALNEVDKKIGHKRVYDFGSLEKEVNATGFEVSKEGGILLKTLSNIQMEKLFSEKLIEAFFKLGKLFPDIACEIIAVCRKKSDV